MHQYQIAENALILKILNIYKLKTENAVLYQQ